MIRNKVFDEGYSVIKRKSKRKEKRVAKLIGGSRRSYSGSFDEAKGDISTKLLLIEHKYTSKKSFSIKREWLEKISLEARSEGKAPGFAFTFDTGGRIFDDWGNEKVFPRDWIAMPIEFFKELIDDR